MSMNSNLKSMLGTLNEHEINFFQELEQKYFNKAQKSNNSDLKFKSSSDNTKSEKSLDLPFQIT